MPEKSPRLLVTLVGDVQRDAFARVKYGLFCEALQRTGSAVSTIDASLRGLPRAWNALQVFSPSLSIWRERFWKNVPAFKARSKIIGRHIRKYSTQWDLVIQLGVVFDASSFQSQLPVVIYTDYTAILSAKRPELGRSPFTADQHINWISKEKSAYLNALHIFTRSRLVYESLIRDYGIQPEKISVIGGGVNFYPLPEIGKRPKRDPVILCLGKEFHRKGGDILLEAFALVREEIPSATLSLVTQSPIPSEQSLSGVNIIAPTWDRNEIARLYTEADLFVLPSRMETWGDVLLEAMAFELPCVGVDIDAMAEIIQNKESGLLVPPQDSKALADAIIHLLNDPHERTRMGQTGRQIVESNFTWDVVAIHMSKILNQLLGEKN